MAENIFFDRVFVFSLVFNVLLPNFKHYLSN